MVYLTSKLYLVTIAYRQVHAIEGQNINPQYPSNNDLVKALKRVKFFFSNGLCLAFGAFKFGSGVSSIPT